ncbi:MAG: hypothetical protein U0931_03025 [Vulcanimicrobiota bacterium]
MNLLGGLLELPGKLLGQGLKALTGQSEQQKKPAAQPPSQSRIRDNVQLSDEMHENMLPQMPQMQLGQANDLDSLQAPLAPQYGMNQGRYDYNPQAARVEKLFESQMMYIPPV